MKSLRNSFEQQKMEHKVMEALVEQDLLKDIKKWRAEEENQITTDSDESKQIPFYRRNSFFIILIGLLIFVIALIWLNAKKEKLNRHYRSSKRKSKFLVLMKKITPPPETIESAPKEEKGR